VLMPDELVALFRDGVLFPQADRNSDWIRLTRGLLFYYGTLSIEELMSMVNNHSEHETDAAAFIEVLNDAAQYYEDLAFTESGYISDIRVEDPAAIRRERALRADLDYCPFTRQQLLKAGEPGYIERGPAFNQLVKFALERYEVDREEAEIMVEHCVDAARNGATLQAVLAEASEFVELPTMESMSAITNLLVPLMNATKQYVIKGYSPMELSSQRAVPQMVMNAPLASKPASNVIDFASKQKVGRNEPCPCGSGKKYKKCCAK
jgi:hypothetical protein